MKVIMAGVSKTGTKTLADAFRILGFVVHDTKEHFLHHRQVWYDYMDEKATIEDIRRSYNGVDVVTGLPVFFFWKQMCEAFPEAKVILSTRDAGGWLKSWFRQLDVWESNYTLICLMTFTPTGWSYFQFHRRFYLPVHSIHPVAPFGSWKGSKVVQLNSYRRHNSDVKMNCPEEKLLLYEVEEGWKPLCEFLDLEIPSTSFPRKNVGATIFDQYLKTDNRFLQMKKELIISIAVVVCITALFIMYVGL